MHYSFFHYRKRKLQGEGSRIETCKDVLRKQAHMEKWVNAGRQQEKINPKNRPRFFKITTHVSFPRQSPLSPVQSPLLVVGTSRISENSCRLIKTTFTLLVNTDTSILNALQEEMLQYSCDIYKNNNAIFDVEVEVEEVQRAIKLI